MGSVRDEHGRTLASATLIDTGTNDNLVSALPGTIIGTYRYLDLTVTSGNILLKELDNSVNPAGVPQPAALTIFGIGLLGMGALNRYRKRGGNG